MFAESRNMCESLCIFEKEPESYYGKITKDMKIEEISDKLAKGLLLYEKDFFHHYKQCTLCLDKIDNITFWKLICAKENVSFPFNMIGDILDVWFEKNEELAKAVSEEVYDDFIVLVYKKAASLKVENYLYQPDCLKDP